MTHIHLMIPDALEPHGLRGTAVYACDQDRSRNLWTPMTQRTLDPAKVTCPDCRAVDEQKAADQELAARELAARAGGAAHAALLDHGGNGTPEATIAALDAAQQVYDEAAAVNVDALMDQCRLLGMDFENAGAALRFTTAYDLAQKITLSFRDLLSAHPGAGNYIELHMNDQATGERYVCIVAKPGGKTPHQLRKQAEAALAALPDVLQSAALARAAAAYSTAGRECPPERFDGVLAELADRSAATLRQLDDAVLRGTPPPDLSHVLVTALLAVTAACRAALGFTPTPTGTAVHAQWSEDNASVIEARRSGEVQP